MSYPLSGAGPGAEPGEVAWLPGAAGADGTSGPAETAGSWVAAAGSQAAVAGDPPAAAGDAPAAASVTGVFRAHHAELVRLAVLLLGDRPSAEDVVQDVFARLCVRDLLPPGEGAVSYVRAAVLNRCRSALRRRALARRLGGVRALPGWDATQPSAEQEAILAEDRRQVLAALARLPRRRREVLVLRYWLGLPEAEIAQVLGISPGTVKSTAARGLAALARALGEQA
jgi:RNA polymerase sigma-70 factor (sigma-E family)